jgi:hypothetical protein
MATTTQLPAEGRAVHSGAEIRRTPKTKTSVEIGIESVPYDSSEAEPAHEDIAQLAYSYWLEREDSGAGSPEEDWLRAERDLRDQAYEK